MTNVERRIDGLGGPPSKLRSPMTSKAFAAAQSVSASSGNGRLNFSRKRAWDSSSSGLTPRSTAPRPRSSPYASRSSQACLVQPGVSSLG